MLEYKIEGGNLPVVICYPEAGQTICTEGGAMSWMSPNMKMDTDSGGGFKKAFGRIWLQTMPISNLARALNPYMVSSSGDGGINIRLRDN